MNQLTETLIDLQKSTKKLKCGFVVTRFVSDPMPDDLDILVKKEDFNNLVGALESTGYQSSSHDYALGGRTKGAQINLVKKDRIKIDLHKDFTWRNSHYFDLDLLWKNLDTTSISGIRCLAPKKGIDNFLILINTIFEKSYFVEKNIKFEYDPVFFEQAKKYGWENTYLKFFELKPLTHFLPVWFEIYSYLEKWHIVSFAYYFFFRIRYLINKRLPYN